MRDRGPWRLWSLCLLIAAGILNSPVVQCQYNEGGARGDAGNLGFSGVELRHDGYVKGETPTIPQTSFSCSAQPYNPGLYADVETQCQVYHVCFQDRQESFLCGPGTNFNQRILACDFWYNFDCQESPTFYSVNADIGKVPETVFRPGQGREPQQPSYPQQPPSGGSYPNRVSVPPPPSRVQPQPQPKPQPDVPPYPSFPQQPPSEGSFPHRGRVPPPPPRVQPQPPRIQPQPPSIPTRPEIPEFRPQPPSIPSRPEIPEFRPQPPSIPSRPEIPEFRPQTPSIPSRPEIPEFRPRPPSTPSRPDIPEFRPQPPSIPSRPEIPEFRPQPPSIPSRPEIPEFRPQPPQVSVSNQYPRVPQPSGQPSKFKPPSVNQLKPSIQQEEDTGYQFDGYNPPKPVSIPAPQPVRPQTSRPVFPPVVSPPRVSRPPLTPPIVRQPEIMITRPRVPVAPRPEYHPDANLKGNNDYRPPQQPRVPQPSRPVGTGYPSYPVPQQPVAQQPAEKPSRRPSYQPPPSIQQEHIDTEYVPPPPPPPPKQPSRPTTTYVPPPPPPIQQEVANIPPPRPQPRPSYRPSPVAQKPVDTGYGEQPTVAQKPVDTGYGKQPPVSPSIIREQQKPAISPPSRPQVSVGARQPQQPQRPKPVFPPPSDHPNSNIKGGPGYNQPPPQVPRFEPTRISRPSIPQRGYQEPPKTSRPSVDQDSGIYVKPATEKQPAATGSGGYKVPQQGRIKKPSEPTQSIYQPPIQVVDHPRSEIKGSDYQGPPVQQQPQRIQSPSTSSGVKRPQTSGGYKQPQVQRPRAPIVVARPQPPSLPTTSIKRTSPSDNQVYEKPQPPAIPPSRVKLPSQTEVQSVLGQTSSGYDQPRFPSHGQIDHPNANVKGGSRYDQPRPHTAPVRRVNTGRPSSPPSSPSTSYEQKTSSPNHNQGFGTGYPQPPRGDVGHVQQHVIQQQEYKPQRSQINSIHSSQKIPHVSSGGGCQTARCQKLPSSSSRSSVSKQVKPDYDSGSSYTRGPDIYPKPEFGQSNGPHQSTSTHSRQNEATKLGPSSQNSITNSQNKPTYQGLPASSGSGFAVRPEYPHREVPGHQPPNQRQVFPHRENPDHPNESLKGSSAYRPPPPAGYQASASEVQEQKVPADIKTDTSSPLLGDVGAE